MPVLLTYASDVVSRYDVVCDAYTLDLIEEARNAWRKFQAKLPIDFPVTIYFIVLPLEDTAEVRDIAHEILMRYQNI